MNFSDMNEDCQRKFLELIPLQERIRLRAVCQDWKYYIEESLSHERVLRIFDCRESMTTYTRCLQRQSLQNDPQLAFGPYNSLILGPPPKPEPQPPPPPEPEPKISEPPKLKFKRARKALPPPSPVVGALFLVTLFPEITNLVIWSRYIECTPGQLNVPMLLAAWSPTLEVLSLRIFMNGFASFKLPTIEKLNKYYEYLRGSLLTLTALKRLHLGEGDPSPNVPFAPYREEFEPSYLIKKSLRIPESVRHLSLMLHQFDHLCISHLRTLEHVEHVDVMYFYNNNPSNPTRNVVHFFLDEFKATPALKSLKLDIGTLHDQLTLTPPVNANGVVVLPPLPPPPLDGQPPPLQPPPPRRLARLSSAPIQSVECLYLTDRLNFLHNNTREVNYNSENFKFHATIFRVIGETFPRVRRLVMCTKFADEDDFQKLVKELIKRNCLRNISAEFIKVTSGSVEEKLKAFPKPSDVEVKEVAAAAGSSAEASGSSASPEPSTSTQTTRPPWMTLPPGVLPFHPIECSLLDLPTPEEHNRLIVVAHRRRMKRVLLGSDSSDSD